MKFTVDTAAFIRMLQILNESPSGGKRGDRALSVTVNRGRVMVAGSGTAAEIEAIVWQDGQCTVPRTRLMKAAKSSPQNQPLTLTLTEQGLRVGTSVLRVLPPPAVARTPQRFAFFLTTGLTLTAPEVVAQFRLAGAA